VKVNRTGKAHPSHKEGLKFRFAQPGGSSAPPESSSINKISSSVDLARRKNSDLISRLQNLFVALVTDTLDDDYGGLHEKRYLMSPDIKPLLPDMRVAGVACTFRGAASAKIGGPIPPLEELRKATWVKGLESIKPNDVVVYATNYCKSVGVLGELMANAFAARGGVGAITDGYARDLNRLLWIKPSFPFFATGSTAADSKGRFEFLDFNEPVWCGGVLVNTGDYILGDFDGVVVIPQKIAEEVITKAEARSKSEDKVRVAFRKGEPIADVFDKYRVA